MRILLVVAMIVAAYIAGFGDGRQARWLARFRYSKREREI